MRNYNEAMLESMSNGVITLDGEGRATTCNAAGGRILRRNEEELVGKPPEEFFSGTEWLLERIRHVAETRRHRSWPWTPKSPSTARPSRPT